MVRFISLFSVAVSVISAVWNRFTCFCPFSLESRKPHDYRSTCGVFLVGMGKIGRCLTTAKHDNPKIPGVWNEYVSLPAVGIFFLAKSIHLNILIFCGVMTFLTNDKLYESLNVNEWTQYQLSFSCVPLRKLEEWKNCLWRQNIDGLFSWNHGEHEICRA